MSSCIIIIGTPPEDVPCFPLCALSPFPVMMRYPSTLKFPPCIMCVSCIAAMCIFCRRIICVIEISDSLVDMLSGLIGDLLSDRFPGFAFITCSRGLSCVQVRLF